MTGCDPLTPESEPWRAQTDPQLVATAYYARSAQIVSDAAEVLGFNKVAAEYADLAVEIHAAFRAEYVTPNARVVSDSATAYAIALQFDLVEDPNERAHLAYQLARICAQHSYTITTGFLGTPLVLPALSNARRFRTAYRLLNAARVPFLALPGDDGRHHDLGALGQHAAGWIVNPGEMTSFNHYALGAVADWMHRTVPASRPPHRGTDELKSHPYPVRESFSRRITPHAVRHDDLRLVHQRPLGPPTHHEYSECNRDRAPARSGRRRIEVGSGTHEWTYDVGAELADKWHGDTAHVEQT